MKPLGALLITLTLLSSYACKKNSSQPSYSVNFTANGTPHSFKFAKGAFTNTTAPGQVLSFSGTNGSSATDEIIFFILTSTNGNIKAGDTFDGNTFNAVVIGYGTVGEGTQYTNRSSIDAKSLVTITSVNETSVKGTFSASLYAVLTGDKKEITNGSFEVNIQR